MTLTIFNGSPRKHKSNSKILTDHFIKGFKSKKNEEVNYAYLAEKDREESNIHLFQQSTVILIIFPLYVDSMPGLVKRFFEKIALLPKPGDKKVGFIIQSGFPEAVHSSYVEKYVRRFTERMGYQYLGSVIRGGVEGIQVMPKSMTKKLYGKFHKLGAWFAEHEHFEDSIAKNLASPMRLTKLGKLKTRFLMLTGLIIFYWNTNLKKNRVYHRRFAQPY